MSETVTMQWLLTLSDFVAITGFVIFGGKIIQRQRDESLVDAGWATLITATAVFHAVAWLVRDWPR